MRRIVNNIIFIYLFFVFILVFWYYNIWNKKILIKLYFFFFRFAFVSRFPIHMCNHHIAFGIHEFLFFFLLVCSTHWRILSLVLFLFFRDCQKLKKRNSLFFAFRVLLIRNFVHFFSKYNIFSVCLPASCSALPQKLFRIHMNLFRSASANQPAICANSKNH